MKTKKFLFKHLVVFTSMFAMSVLTYVAIAQPPASELEWKIPYETALQVAKTTGKPMLVFVGNTEICKDCQKFISSVCTQKEFIEYASKSLVCTQVLYSKSDSNEDKFKKSRIVEAFNIPSSHALIIVNSDGKRIGELSTAQESITSFIQEIQTIIAKAPAEGRLKYSEVNMFDKTFVPDKTYTTELPKFSPKPLKGRYINLMTAVRLQSWENTRTRTHGQNNEPQKHTPEIALRMRKSVAEAFPGARITWSWSWGALTDNRQNYADLRKLMVQFVKEYGDEMTFWPGVDFANKFNTQEQCKKDLHEGLQLVSQMVGNGYRPKSVVAGHMSVESMKFLAEKEGIHTVQGQIWSQFNIDGQDGDGGIIYPYYPSKDHFLKPAQGPRGGSDFVDVVNIDGWTVDFFAARLRGMGKDFNSRMGIGPLETNACCGTKLGLREMMHTSDVHFNDKAVAANGYGFLTVIWELTLFEWIDPNYLPSWLKAMREKYPDTQMLNTGEFGDLWRKHNPDNSRINLKFVERGNDMPSEEEGKKIATKYRFHTPIFCPDMEIRWYFNKDFRFATIHNWKENSPKLVMDYTRYNQPYKEPSGNVIERHWDILDIINQKQSRPQDIPKPFSELPLEEQKKILKWYPDINK
jgi:thioredoxin-related protein